MMRTFLGVLVLAWSCIVPQMARAAEAPAQDGDEVETLKRLGQQMGDAMVARDIAALDRIFADDWVSVGASGKVVTKESVLQGSSPEVTRSIRSCSGRWTSWFSATLPASKAP
jgi:hypothetical protein